MGLSDHADHSDRLVCENCHGQYEIETIAGTRRKVLRCAACDATEEVWMVPARNDAWTAISPSGFVTRHASWSELTAIAEPTDPVRAGSDETSLPARDVRTPPTPDVNAKSATPTAQKPLRPQPPRPTPRRPSVVEDVTPALLPTAKLPLSPTPPRTMTSVAPPPPPPVMTVSETGADAPDTPKQDVSTPLRAMIAAVAPHPTDNAEHAEMKRIPLPPPSITVDDSLPVLPSTRASSRPAQESAPLMFEEPRARRPWLLPVVAILVAVCAFYIIRSLGEAPAPEIRMMTAASNAMPVVTTMSNTLPVASMESPPPSPPPAETTDPSSASSAAGAVASSSKAPPAKKPHSLPKLLDQARAARSAGDLELARELYERMLDEHPGNVEAFAGLGDIARQQGDLELAKTEYEKALSLSPRYMPALLGAADALWDLGEHEAAKTHYLTILELSNAPPERVKVRALGERDERGRASSDAEALATPKADEIE